MGNNRRLFPSSVKKMASLFIGSFTFEELMASLWTGMYHMPSAMPAA